MTENENLDYVDAKRVDDAEADRRVRAEDAAVVAEYEPSFCDVDEKELKSENLLTIDADDDYFSIAV